MKYKVEVPFSIEDVAARSARLDYCREKLRVGTWKNGSDEDINPDTTLYYFDHEDDALLFALLFS